ncbi:MAG: glycerate kinase [Ramlibacter sp.]
MNFYKKVAVSVITVVVLAGAWRVGGVAGLVLVVSGMVTWGLFHFTRVMRVLRSAAERPVGRVESAVMLNTGLKRRASLLHVVAATQSLGERLSEKDAEPAIYRWSDAGGAHVTCEFANGKLVKWTLERPVDEDQSATPPAP